MDMIVTVLCDFAIVALWCFGAWYVFTFLAAFFEEWNK
jgi:hypothetical protein